MENASAAKAPHTTACRTPPKEVDARGMVVIHRGLCRESRLLPELIAAVAAGHTARAAVLADYQLGLHNYHHGKDSRDSAWRR